MTERISQPGKMENLSGFLNDTSITESITNSCANSKNVSERIMCSVNNVCQSQRNEECQTRDIHTCTESACVCQKLLWISRILIPIYLICIVTVFSFETILKDHELILSTYNRAADLNEQYRREVNNSKRVITSLEQNISKVEEE